MSPPYSVDKSIKRPVYIKVEFTAKEYAEWLLKTGDRFKNGCIMPKRVYVDWQGKRIPVYRFLFAALKGDIPAHTVIMHTCDNNPCINPEHLEGGTQIQNALDAKKRGKNLFREIWLSHRNGI